MISGRPPILPEAPVDDKRSLMHDEEKRKDIFCSTRKFVAVVLDEWQQGSLVGARSLVQSHLSVLSDTRRCDMQEDKQHN